MIAFRSNNPQIRPPVLTWRVALLSCAFGFLPISAFAQTATNAPVQLGLPSGGQSSSGQSGSDQSAGDDTGNDQPNYNPGGITATPLPPLSGQMPGDGEAAPAGAGESISNAAPDNSANATTSQATPQAAPGLIDDRQGGLGARMWQGSSVVKLTSLLPKLPAPVTEPALRDLQLRLLLTQAAGPTAAAGIDSLVPLRADRLHVMGFDAEALQLAQQRTTPGVVSDPREAIDRLWASDDKDGACSQVKTQIADEQSIEPYWRRALVFCQILQGDTDQASIGVDLLREQAAGDQQTKDFIAVASVLLGDTKAQNLKKPIANPDSLLAAMMKQAKLPGAEGSGSPKPVGAALAAATARDGSKPLPERLQAGETAFATGLISTEDLTGLYQQVKPAASDAELAGADTPEHRARLYQRAQQGQMPDSRLQWVTQALREARARGDYFSAVPLYAPLLEQMTPNPNLAQFAPEAARALFAAGNTDRAGFWLNLATGPGSNAQTARDAAGLRLLGRIAGLYGSRDAGTDPVADWRQASGADEAAAQRLYGILAGLGESVGGRDATTFAGGNSDIAAAAQAGRRGETVLLALVALNGSGKKLAQADGAALAQSLGGLTAVGLQQDARRIGTEAAILAGL